jgi:uncharacterized protein (TIGR03067 family)
MFNLKTMKTSLMILLASVVVITSVYSEPQKSDSDTIQGQWQGTEKDAAPDQHSSLTISGKNLEFHGSDTNEWYKGTFTIHEDTNPKQFIGVIKDCPSSDCIGLKVCAIYRIENGAFTICGSGPGETNFPTSFDGPGARQIVFKRK